ncbi:type ISP restriction/modification enzyme, partial [Marinobacter sp. 1Y8]
NSSGVKTHRDNFIIDTNKESLLNRIKTFFDDKYSDEEVKNLLDLKDNRDWSVSEARKSKVDEKFIKVMSYRPFDHQFIYYDTSLIDFARENTLGNISKDNIGIVFSRQATAAEWSSIQVENKIVDNRYHTSYKGIPQQAPLYLYPKDEAKSTRTPNLDLEIVSDIAKAIGLTFTNEKSDEAGTFAPIDILDYIYAV